MNAVTFEFKYLRSGLILCDVFPQCSQHLQHKRNCPPALLRGLLTCTAGNQVLDDLKRRLPASVTLDLVPLSAHLPPRRVHLVLRAF